MHSALRPYMTTGLAIVGSSVLAFAPIAPPAPAESATTTTQSAQQVTLKAKVITINPSPDAVDVKDAGGKGVFDATLCVDRAAGLMVAHTHRAIAFAAINASSNAALVAIRKNGLGVHF